MFGEDDKGGEERGDLPDEAGVGGEPLDVALVAAIEEDGAAGVGPLVRRANQVALLEGRQLREAEVVQPLPEVVRFVLVCRLSVPRRIGVRGGEVPQEPRCPPRHRHRHRNGENRDEGGKEEESNGESGQPHLGLDRSLETCSVD